VLLAKVSAIVVLSFEALCALATLEIFLRLMGKLVANEVFGVDKKLSTLETTGMSEVAV
jgi:hypothetical protein